MDFPKKQQQCLIPRYLLQYLQDLQITHTDPTAPWGGGGGGGSYTAGDGIDITNDVISVDDTVALKTDLLDYVTTSELTTELSNYVTSTDLATELLDYAELSDLATVATTGSYNDLSNKPSIPTKTSDLTNDSGYITPNYLSNYVTLNGVQTISGSKTFTGLTVFKGTYYNVYFGQSTGFSVSDKNNPVQESMSVYPGYLSAHRDTGNTTLDGNFFLGNHYFCAYNSDTEYKIKLVSKGGATTYGEYTFKNKTGDVAITSEIPTATSDLTNDSGYITSSALTGYATESWVTNQGYSTFSGNYNDLTNKPTIPDAVSGTNDGTNWTSLTIGSNTYGLASGSAPSNMVTTNTTQTISGPKTFTNAVNFSPSNLINDVTFNTDAVFNDDAIFGSAGSSHKFKFYGRNPIEMYAPAGRTTGFTLFDSFSEEKGYLQYNSSHNAIYLGRYGSNSSSPANYVGFLNETGTTGYRVLVPNKQVTGSATTTNNTYYIPTEITDGTTTVKASSDGVVNISSLIGGGGSAPTNMVTTDTIQNITGIKTFVGKQLLKFKQSSNTDTLGFTAYDNYNNEVGNLQIANRRVGSNYNMYVTLGNYSGYPGKSKVGFRLQPNSSTNSYNFVMPYGTNDQFINNGYSTSADTTIPCAFTDGTTIVKADATGLVNISSISGGSGGSSMSNYIIRFIGNGSGTNCDVSIRCTLKDNSTLVPGIYTTFDDTDMALIDYLNAALVGITTYDYRSREFAIFTEFYFADNTTLEYDGFEIAEIKISQLAY